MIFGLPYDRGVGGESTLALDHASGQAGMDLRKEKLNQITG
jgi:hypothetical protein